MNAFEFGGLVATIKSICVGTDLVVSVPASPPRHGPNSPGSVYAETGRSVVNGRVFIDYRDQPLEWVADAVVASILHTNQPVTPAVADKLRADVKAMFPSTKETIKC